MLYELIRQAFELYAEGKFTIVPLVDELYRMGLRNRVSTRVTRNGLSTILNNPFYVGVIRIKKTGDVYAGNHEPLITDAYLDGTIEREIYEERKAALLFERRAIEDRLNDLKTGKTSIPEEVQEFLELAGDAYSLYKTPIIEKKRRLLKMVTSNCSVDEGTLDFTYAIPFREVAQREKSIDGGPSKVVHRTLDTLLSRLLAHFKKHPRFNTEADAV
jgi:Recombinase